MKNHIFNQNGEVKTQNIRSPREIVIMRWWWLKIIFVNGWHISVLTWLVSLCFCSLWWELRGVDTDEYTSTSLQANFEMSLWLESLACQISPSFSQSSDVWHGIRVNVKKEKILLWQSHAILRFSRSGLVISLEKIINADMLWMGEKLRKMWMSTEPLSEY